MVARVPGFVNIAVTTVNTYALYVVVRCTHTRALPTMATAAGGNGAHTLRRASLFCARGNNAPNEARSIRSAPRHVGGVSCSHRQGCQNECTSKSRLTRTRRSHPGVASTERAPHDPCALPLTTTSRDTKPRARCHSPRWRGACCTRGDQRLG